MRTPPPSESLVSFNLAATALVDELLRLPSASATLTAVELLYGRDVAVPSSFLDHVGTGVRIPVASVLASSAPLAILVAGRLRPSSAWQEPAHALKGARALARERYRELQAALIGSSVRSAPEPFASLVRYTYGVDDRRWLWADVARRLLDTVVTLNRGALGLLAAVARGETTLDVGVPTVGPRWSYDMPPAVLNVLAEVLPPAAVPDFPAFVRALDTSQASVERDEATMRYRSLFAEMLGLATHAEALA